MHQTTEQALRQLVDDYRTRCLWFLKPDYFPVTAPECERVLQAIEEHGDLDAFRRVTELRAWRGPELGAGGTANVPGPRRLSRHQ